MELRNRETVKNSTRKMALQSTTEVILDGLDTYHEWYAMIKTSIVKDL
jgi:hypothetical protein